MLPLLADQHARALERLSPDVYAYYATGSGEEVTLGESRDGWLRHRLRPHVLRDVHAVDTSCALMDETLSTPVLVAPTAFHRLAHHDGEVATARAARAAGSLMTASTRATRTFEDIGSAADGPWWLQTYVVRDRGLTLELAARAKAAGATALVLTGDTPYVGPKKAVAALTSLTDEMVMTNFGRHLTGAEPDDALDQDPSIDLSTIGWLREELELPVLVKGVLRGDDARACVDAGAVGIVVSTHGGRQLDRAVSSASALPEVVAAVGDSVPVLVDGGVRSGADVLVALALGAKAVLVGRPVLWALAADGADGVRAVIDALTTDLEVVMALAGVTSLEQITRDMLASRD